MEFSSLIDRFVWLSETIGVAWFFVRFFAVAVAIAISGFVSKISELKFQLKSNETSRGTNVKGQIVYLYPSQAELLSQPNIASPCMGDICIYGCHFLPPWPQALLEFTDF
jgi:hypothetical protein